MFNRPSIASTISRPIRQILEFVKARQTWRHMMHYSSLRQLTLYQLCLIQISFFSVSVLLSSHLTLRDEFARKRHLRRLFPLHLRSPWHPVQLPESWEQLYQNTFALICLLFCLFVSWIQNLFPKYWRLLTHTLYETSFLKRFHITCELKLSKHFTWLSFNT